MKLKIKENEHVFTCGKTGSGKTFANKIYLASYPNVVVLDTKGTFTWEQVPDCPIVEHLQELEDYQEGKVIYRPSFEELNREYYEEFFKWCYLRKNCIVYVDEIMSISDNASYIPKYAKAILTRGRERNTSLWGATQRPKTIPLVYMSESTHFFIFQLNLLADKKRVMEIIPCDEILEDLPKYEFWYYNTEMDNPVLAKLVKK